MHEILLTSFRSSGRFLGCPDQDLCSYRVRFEFLRLRAARRGLRCRGKVLLEGESPRRKEVEKGKV